MEMRKCPDSISAALASTTLPATRSMRRRPPAPTGSGAYGLHLQLSRDSGIDARDIMNLRRFTRDKGLLVIIRCPKATARGFHGTLPGKTFATKAKTNQTGTVLGHGGTLMVSD